MGTEPAHLHPCEPDFNSLKTRDPARPTRKCVFEYGFFGSRSGQYDMLTPTTEYNGNMDAPKI
jgi:hypothetical protein